MDDKYSEFLHTQRIVAEARADMLYVENGRLKERIKELERMLDDLKRAQLIGDRGRLGPRTRPDGTPTKSE